MFSLAGAFFFFRHIWGIEQQEYARIRAVQVFLFQKPSLCSSIDADRQKGYEEVVVQAQRASDQNGKHRWWTISAFDAYYMRWVGKQLGLSTEGGPGPNGHTSQAIPPQPELKPPESADSANSTEIVEVTSSPGGATVFIDGHNVGKTPMPSTASVGKHSMRLELSGHKVWGPEMIEVKPGVENKLAAAFTQSD